MSDKKNEPVTEEEKNVAEPIVNEETSEESISVEEILNASSEEPVKEELPEDWREKMLADGATEEDIKRMEKLLSKTSFYAVPVIKGSAKEMKKELRGQTIISDDDEDVSTTDALKEDMLELNASSREGRVLDGRIVGCRTANPESKIATNMAIVSFGNGTCQVLIPDFVLFNFDVKIERTPDFQKKLEQKVVSMIGAEIKFVVKQFDMKTKTAYGDRLKAMEQTAYNNFTRRLSNTGKPRVNVGDIIYGRVTAVKAHYITVYALGVETNIYQDKRKNLLDVSWYHIDDLRRQYKVNDRVACKVKSVSHEVVKKYNEEYSLVAAELSVKECDEDPQVKYFNDYTIGQFCECIISTVDESAAGVYGIITNGVSRVDCLISFPKYGSMPQPGDRRLIRITEKAEKTERGALLEKDGRAVRRIFGVFADT